MATETTKIELDGPDLSEYGDDNTLVGFIEELTEILDQIPEAHKKQATIRCACDFSTSTALHKNPISSMTFCAADE